MYKLLKDKDGTIRSVFKFEFGAIPFDPANRDFQEYQEWIALGNQPLPADEQPSS
jgi:hypothetical protein